MIAVKNLVKSYTPDPPVLNGINFTAEKGELIVILGASGSGKTSLVRCLTLKEKWDSGEYIYEGQDMLASTFGGKRLIWRDFAFLEEQHGLNPKKNPLKVVLAGRRRHFPLFFRFTGLIPSEEHMGAMDYLEKVGLIDKAKQKIGGMSGGEQQRTAIAKALAQGAKVIIADEPVSGLDPFSAERVMRDIQQVCQNEQIIVLCILHQIDLAEKFASRILGLSNGELVIDIRGRRLTQREKNLIL